MKLIYNFYMIECVSEAIVLGWENLKEQDRRVFLFTRDYGKISAKATSAQKSVSKLAAHLEPFNLITVRLVSKKDVFDAGGFHLTDALLIDSAGGLKSDAGQLKNALQVYDLINRSIPEGVPDGRLWEILEDVRGKKESYRLADALRLLGFDISYAVCELCQGVKPEYFFPKNNFFVCGHCKFASGSKDLISII